MLKHIEDDGDLSLLVNDAGALLLVCSNGHQWIATAKPVTDAQDSTRSSLADALRGSSSLQNLRGIDMRTLEA